MERFEKTRNHLNCCLWMMLWKDVLIVEADSLLRIKSLMFLPFPHFLFFRSNSLAVRYLLIKKEKRKQDPRVLWSRGGEAGCVKTEEKSDDIRNLPTDHLTVIYFLIAVNEIKLCLVSEDSCQLVTWWHRNHEFSNFSWFRRGVIPVRN